MIFLLIRFGLSHCYDIQDNTVFLINRVVHIVDRFVWDSSVFTQYSYYRDLFCLGTASCLCDFHHHVWVRYIDTAKIMVWCMSLILIYMTYFSVFTIRISEIYWAIVSDIPTPGQQVSEILWNIPITIWCLCQIFQFLLNTVIIMTSFVWGQHNVFVIAIVTCESAISILKNNGLVYVIDINIHDLFFCFYSMHLRTLQCDC